MPTDNPKRPSLTEIRSALEEVNQAILLHSKAMAAWSRNAICSLPFDEQYLNEEAYKSCDFGHWYYSNHLEIVKTHPAFIATREAHKAIHESLRQIAKKLNQGEKVTTEEADAFLLKEGEFLSSLSNLRDELFSLSYSYDYLTGTLNRQAFFQLLDREYARLLRSNEPCSLAMVDLDFFKGINDKYGHQAGDDVLQHVANFLNQCLRPYDLICRFGGEEFLLCLPHASVEVAFNTIERLRKQFSESEITLASGEKIRVTASFGIAPLGVDTPPDKSIEHADAALYQAKNQGRNRTIIWAEKSE